MSKGYTTKFNIGDTVYFIEDETVFGETCSCCGMRKLNATVKKIHRSTVKEIWVNEYSEHYNLTAPRSLPVEKLYETKEKAEEHLND